MQKSEKTIINYVLSWDWKDQPNWDSVQIAVNELSRSGHRPFFYDVDTGSDEYALLISNLEDLTNQQISEFYLQTLQS